jgi:hypothetical protein
MNIRGPRLDKTVRQSSHVPYLVHFSLSIFLVVVSKHSGPGNLPLGHDLCKFGQHGFRVPRRALPVQLIAGKDNEVRSLGIENFCKESRGEVVRAVAWGDGGIAANTWGDSEVQVGNLEDPELPIFGEM